MYLRKMTYDRDRPSRCREFSPFRLRHRKEKILRVFSFIKFYYVFVFLMLTSQVVRLHAASSPGAASSVFSSSRGGGGGKNPKDPFFFNTGGGNMNEIWYDSPLNNSGTFQHNKNQNMYSIIDGHANGSSIGLNIPDEQFLIAKLLKNYDPASRPVYNASKPVTIRFGFSLIQICDMDERNQILTTNVWLEQEWHDERLKWNRSEFNNLDKIRIPCNRIWLPDIVLYNSADDYTDGYMQSKAMVKPDGEVFWPPPAKLRSSCKIDVTFFPFDDQVCHLKFGSWTYSGLQVDLINKSSTTDLTNYIKSGEWDLKSVSVVRNVQYYPCCPDEPYPDIVFYIYIRRRILYYLFNIIFPCVWLSILSLIGFWLPPDSGEKITLGITVLLAFSVFMLLIAENIPATSEMVPLIGIYLTMTMSLTSMSIVLTVLVLQLHHAGPFAPNLPRKFYYFMTRRVAFYVGMTSTVERYERLKVITAEKKREEELKAKRSTQKPSVNKSARFKSVEDNFDDSDGNQPRGCCCCPPKEPVRRVIVENCDEDRNFKEFKPKPLSSSLKRSNSNAANFQDETHYDNHNVDFTQIEISVDMKTSDSNTVSQHQYLDESGNKKRDDSPTKIPITPSKSGPSKQLTLEDHRADLNEKTISSILNSPNRLVKSGTTDMTPVRTSQTSLHRTNSRQYAKQGTQHCSCNDSCQHDVQPAGNLTPLKIVQLKSLKYSSSQPGSTNMVPSSPHTSKCDHQNQHSSHHHHHYHHHHQRDSKYKCSLTSSPSITLIGNNSFNLRSNNLNSSTRHSHGDTACEYNKSSFKKCSCSYKKDYILAIENFTKSVNSYLSRQDHDASRNNLQNEWKLVSLIVDRVLFWTFTTLTVISSIILLVIVPVLKNRDIISTPAPVGTPPNPID